MWLTEKEERAEACLGDVATTLACHRAIIPGSLNRAWAQSPPFQLANEAKMMTELPSGGQATPSKGISVSAGAFPPRGPASALRLPRPPLLDTRPFPENVSQIRGDDGKNPTFSAINRLIAAE